MELDLNARSSKWKREQTERREQAKRKLETERRARAAAARAQEQLEAAQAERRAARLEEQVRAEQQALEEQRVTGGVRYLQQLRPVPTTSDGDKITLPVSALEELNPQNATDLGVLTFELSYESSSDGSSARIQHKTHAGVLEFVAEEGTVGLPPKVAASLFQHRVDTLPSSVQVRFVRLEQGKFASLQPRGDGFGERELDLKLLLERVLKTHTTLTEGDLLFVRHGKETFEVRVAELRPETAVNVLNTDLEVDLLPCEAVAKAQEAKKRLDEEAARALELARQQEQRKEAWKAEKTALLPPEPPADERQQVKLLLRLPGGAQATRRFLHSASLLSVFGFVEALTGEEAKGFQLAATYPRRLFTVDGASKSLQELGLNGRQEALFVEKIAGNEPEPEALSGSQSEGSANDTTQGRTRLPGTWEDARRALETSLDELLSSSTLPAIHAMEPNMPVAQSTDQETKWQAQLKELEAMGFANRALNIEVLERYQGRLLRVVNFLSELGGDAGVTVADE